MDYCLQGHKSVRHGLTTKTTKTHPNGMVGKFELLLGKAVRKKFLRVVSGNIHHVLEDHCTLKMVYVILLYSALEINLEVYSWNPNQEN